MEAGKEMVGGKGKGGIAWVAESKSEYTHRLELVFHLRFVNISQAIVWHVRAKVMVQEYNKFKKTRLRTPGRRWALVKSALCSYQAV